MRPGKRGDTPGGQRPRGLAAGPPLPLLRGRRPALLRSLILIEAGPGAPDPALPARIAACLDSWPTPFDSPASAAEFFGHEAWARNLEQRPEGPDGPEGWYPRVDRRATLAATAELADTSYHSAWAATTCPTLVVRGANGTMPEADATTMPASRAPAPPPASRSSRARATTYTWTSRTACRPRWPDSATPSTVR